LCIHTQNRKQRLNCILIFIVALFTIAKGENKLGMLIHDCNSSTWEAEAGRAKNIIQLETRNKILTHTTIWMNLEDITG
jgi:hypothetical protein